MMIDDHRSRLLFAPLLLLGLDLSLRRMLLLETSASTVPPQALPSSGALALSAFVSGGLKKTGGTVESEKFQELWGHSSD